MTMWLETLKIKVPFTMKHHPDNESLYRADIMPKPDYPKADGVLTFDRLSSVFISNTNHEEDQPVHLQLRSEENTSELQSLMRISYAVFCLKKKKEKKKTTIIYTKPPTKNNK